MGISACFPDLRPLNDTSAYGGCACEGYTGLGGETCSEQTTATTGCIVLMLIPLVMMVLVALRFLPTLFFVICQAPARKQRVLKANAVGTSYVATWIAVIAILLNTSSATMLAFYHDQQVYDMQNLTERIQIVFLGLAIMNLIAVFVELSITMKAINNIERFRWPVILAVGVSFLALMITYLLSSLIVAVLVNIIAVFFLVVLSYAGPSWVFIQASFANQSQQVANFHVDDEQRKKITKSKMCFALFQEACLGSKYLGRLFGYSSSSQGYMHSGSNKDTRNDRSVSTPAGGSKVDGGAPQHFSATRNAGSNNSKDAHVPAAAPTKPMDHKEEKKQDRTVLGFFSRALRLGVWLGNCLALFVVGSVLILGAILQYDPNPTFRLYALGACLKEIGLALSVYQILWFVDDGYTRAKYKSNQVENDATLASKNSKLMSPHASKLDESRFGLATMAEGEEVSKMSSMNDTTVVAMTHAMNASPSDAVELGVRPLSKD